MIIMHSYSIIAQAAQDISSVPADFVKNWWMMVGFAAVLYMQWRNGQTQRREVSGRLVTTTEDEPATHTEVEGLRKEIDSLLEQNHAEHREAIRAGENRVINLSEVFDSKHSELNATLERIRTDLNNRMDENFTRLHVKIDPLAAQSASSSALIAQIDKRLTMLEEQHNTSVRNLNSRIDDAMQKAAYSKI